jgi:phospho-N-acetylmuramoyl-pentapeptide-transferase
VLIAPLVSLIVGAILSPFIMRLLIAAKSRQIISRHVAEHAHKQGTPTMGGFIILAGWLAGLGVYALQVSGPGPEVPPELASFLSPWPWLAVAAGFAVIGFADDYLISRLRPGRRGLDWITKLVLQTVFVGGAAMLAGMAWEQAAWAWFLVLLFSNAYNFSDGIDMLAGTLGLVMSVVIAVIAFTSDVSIKASGPFQSYDFAGGDAPSAILFLCLAASFLPFLVWNAHPAKVFMGDAGSMPIGALFGWFVARWTWAGETGAGISGQGGKVWLAAFIFSIPMLLELVPAALQVVHARFLKRRLFKFRTPVHHAFQAAGWPEARIVWLFAGVQVLCSLAALAVLDGGRG